MIITRTPFRVSFVGGGSDLPSFYRRHEGCVLSTSINKYMYVVIHPTFNGEETIIKYKKTEIVDKISDIQHPIARQLLTDYKLSGVEIVSTADIPSGTGLSTSSAYTVGLIHAINAYLGKYKSQEKIAQEACKVEIEEVGDPIGKQDQYGTAIGGLKLIKFRSDDTVDLEPVIVKPSILKELNDNLMLFYTGITHSAGEILKKQSDDVQSDVAKFNNTVRMTELAYDMRDALISGDLRSFGDILDENWQLKRELSGGISNQTIDEYYNIGKSNGALGGKLLGAGGGGFMLFYCPKEKQYNLRKAMPLTELPFDIESSGTKVIYVGDKNWE